MPPHQKIGDISFYQCLSVRPSVCLSVCLHKLAMKLNIFPLLPTFFHYSQTNLLTRLIFGMKAHLIDTHLLVPRSRSSTKVRVKYQGQVSQKMGVSGAVVFHKDILFYHHFQHRPTAILLLIANSF